MVNVESVGEDEGDTDGDDSEKDAESFRSRCGIVDCKAIGFGMESGVDEVWKGAKAKEDNQEGNGGAGREKSPSIIAFAHLVVTLILGGVVLFADFPKKPALRLP